MSDLSEKKRRIPKIPGRENIEKNDVINRKPQRALEPREDLDDITHPIDLSGKDIERKIEREGNFEDWRPDRIFEIKPIHVSIIRPRDLLLLDFLFKNFRFGKDPEDNQQKLYRAVRDNDAYVIVTFRQQSIFEEAFFEKEDPEPVPVEPPDSDVSTGDESPDNNDPPIRSRISGTSRLVFTQPDDAEPIPYTIEGLLRIMREYPLRVSATSRPPEDEPTTPEFTLAPEFLTHARARYAGKTFDKTYDVQKQYSLSKRAMIQSYEQLRTERSRLVQKIDQVGHALEHELEMVPGVLEVLKPELEPPTDLETSIEMPFRLILSPNRYAAWVHELSEVVATRKIFYGIYPTLVKETKAIQDFPKRVEKKSSTTLKSSNMPAKSLLLEHKIKEEASIEKLLQANDTASNIKGIYPNLQFFYENIDWVELWHTRLATRNGEEVDEGENPLRTVRAIWAKDACFSKDVGQVPQPYPPGSSDDPFRASLDSCDRFNIVHLSANYKLKHLGTGKHYIPRAIPVKRMMLTSLGAWLNLRGAWEPPVNELEVEEWRHRATMARDHYVRVVYKGYLFPFGHRASLVKVTERKFHNRLNGNPAYLRQRIFIVVREPERIYPLTELKNGDGHQYDLAFPFTRVRITTLVTPLLDKPENSQIGTEGRRLFRPVEGSTGKEIRFHVVAEDLEGREVEFSIPMIFVGNAVKANTNLLTDAQENYTGTTTGAAPAELNDQTVCFAPSEVQGDTTLNIGKIWFGAQIPTSNLDKNKLQNIYSTDTPLFFPRVEKASAHIPAIQHIAGNDGTAKFKYHADFLKHGFGTNNQGEVFTELIETIPLSFSDRGQNSGALLTPDMNINGLSRKYGPIGGSQGSLTEMTNDTFDAAKFFEGMSPMLFGAIPLFELVDAVGGPPTFLTQAMTPIQALLKNLENLKNQLETLSGVAANLQTAANALKVLITTAIDNLSEIILKITVPEPIDALVANLQTNLQEIQDKIQEVLAALNAPGIPASVRIPLEDALNSMGAVISDMQDILSTADDFIGYFQQLNQLITEQKISLDWQKDLMNWPSGGDPIFEGTGANGKASLKLHAEVDGKAASKGTPAFFASCGLHAFNLNLIGKDSIAGFIILKFTKIEFAYASGSKADVNVEFGGVEFIGVLSFVETLKTLIPLDGFSDPPGLDISEKGITASYSLPLPNIAVGMFSLANMSLSAGFSVPFIGDPLSVWFGFCSRENPFTLTVSMFGGGGFFAITLQPHGLKTLEAAFEFGASISVDFGVASGGVHAMAGIYFKMEVNDDGSLTAQLTGYFRMGGHVRALGIISVSIELYLELTYIASGPDEGKCTGRAELTIEVSVLFFSVSVTITAERKFAGSNGDPTFAELMAPYHDPVDDVMVDPWEKYCMAFA